jgi:hypothetical protein
MPDVTGLPMEVLAPEMPGESVGNATEWFGDAQRVRWPRAHQAVNARRAGQRDTILAAARLRRDAERAAQRDVTIKRCFYPLLLCVLFAGIVWEILTDQFGAISPLDDLIHFCSPAILGSIIFREIYVDSRKMCARDTWITVTGLGGFTELIWELWEWTMDGIWHTQWQLDNADTMGDIRLGLLGAAVGATGHVLLDRWTPG